MVAMRYGYWSRTQKTVFATPKSISTGPPNPFNSRSPPRVRDSDGNITLAPSRFGSNFSKAPEETSRTSTVAKPRLLLRPSLLSQVGNGETSAAPASSVFGTLSAPQTAAPSQNLFSRTLGTEEPVANGTSDSDHSKKDGITSTSSFRTPVTSAGESFSHPRVGTSVTNSTPSFVFGQNIHERVLVGEPAEKTDSAESRLESASNGESQPGLLFSSVAKESSSQAATAANSKTLNESAQEYEAARAAKRRYDEVEVMTGEEEETNVLQVGCKLHIFDKGLWAERGRGHIRLNDKVVDNQMTSRMVMRCQGTLRILINSKIWPGMTLERSSEKSVRLTGYDNGQIKVFLITASPKDADLIYSAMEYRLAAVRAAADSQNDDTQIGSKRRRESEESPESDDV